MGTEEQIDYEEAYNRVYLGLKFKKHREELGLDAETVAEQAGYSIFQYTMMEEGNRQISVDDYFRVADVWYAYEDAQYPALERKLRQFWRGVKRQFLLWEIVIEHEVPGAKAVFEEIPLRLIVFFILMAGPVLMFLGNQILFGEENVFYHAGYAIGKFYRMISDFFG